MESQPTSPPPRDSPSDQEAEVFAASAAEGAITDRKDAAAADDLDTLTDAIQQSSISKEEPGAASTVSEEKESAVVQQPARSEEGADDGLELDKALTKEELIEEALNCPCIASMKEGPCGDPFIEAYKCFLQSETEPKGMDCMEQFKSMQSCIAEHPDEYNLDDDDDAADPFAAQKEPAVDGRGRDHSDAAVAKEIRETDPTRVAASSDAAPPS